MLILLYIFLYISNCQHTPLEVCIKYNSQWKTAYAPDSPTDVNWNNPLPVSNNVNPNTCKYGNVVDIPFMSDAVRRINYYRWLSGLNGVMISQTNQQKSQECALMMAINNNPNSPGFHPSSDPHTEHPGWQCATPGATEAARLSNVYSGQSMEDVGFLWGTTPAHILKGFIDDFSSSKQGHRQNIFCPNLNDISFGHVCYYEPVVRRYFCGGCQWAYGRDTDPMPNIGFVAWPPNGTVPADLIPNHPYYWWSFANFINNTSVPPTVKINNQLVESDIVYPLCNGEGVSGKPDRTLTWLRFQPPNYGLLDILNVEVRSVDGQTWRYTVQTVDCVDIMKNAPTSRPTLQPTGRPTGFPTPLPTESPTPLPTWQPTELPPKFPTLQPSSQPTPQPSPQPTPQDLQVEKTWFTISTVYNTVTMLTVIIVGIFGLRYLIKYKFGRQVKHDSVDIINSELFNMVPMGKVYHNSISIPYINVVNNDDSMIFSNPLYTDV